MLGDSLRRRRAAPTGARPAASPRPPRRRGLSVGRWLIAAVVILLGAFGTGYLLSTLVLFPAPETAGSGVPVPDLYGLEREEAEAALAAAGLGVGDVDGLASADVPAGNVIAQSPVAGQQLRPGGTVSMTVSAGPPEVRVPTLTGLGLSTARALLERAGFGVAVRQVPSGEPEGTIARTDPPPGAETRLPAEITLYVSLGPPRLELAPGPVTTPVPGAGGGL